CSAPFLAPALGAALALPTTESFVIFTAIALGLSAPYLLLSLFPAAIKVLRGCTLGRAVTVQGVAFPGGTALDFSPVCEKEHACFVDDLAKFSALDAQVFGISVDSVWAHKAFAKQLQINYPLLADFHPKGAVADQYGAYLADKGITARTNFVIDKDGKVALIQTNDIPKVPELEPLLAALSAGK
ncbi:MAG: redoxin domain-containing protein, partial [Myxococcota bacterium]